MKKYLVGGLSNGTNIRWSYSNNLCSLASIRKIMETFFILVLIGSALIIGYFIGSNDND